MARQINLELEDDNLVDVDFSHNGEVLYTIRLDPSDRSTPVRYSELLQEITNISEATEKAEAEINAKYADTSKNDVNVEYMLEFYGNHVKAMEQIVEAINGLFGDDCIQSIYAEHYENNEDYMPDEYAIMAFLDKLIPVMEEVYGQRFEACSKKYNVKRKGGKRHNLTKEELIQKQMGK